MTPLPTERRSLPVQVPSGGDEGLGGAASSHQEEVGPGTKGWDHSSAGQEGSGMADVSGASHTSAAIANVSEVENASVQQRDVSQHHEKLHQSSAADGERKPGVEAATSGPGSSAKDMADQTALPFPKRPVVASIKSTTAETTTGGASEAPRSKDPKFDNTPHSTSRPKHSQVLESDDYSLWTGNHAEDRTSEIAIKGGYQVKQVVLNETNTARPTLGPHLKSSSGLQNLSTFFTSILEKRYDRGRVTAASTFKPPPRVTLTDTKREIWLGELANSSVPLRKLSRTIPHGIRGKVLLEQCLAKSVPMSRAIWLAKCVGANELRAFRRKGISGAIVLENEQKWIRDWTMILESFIEDAGRVTETEWKARIVYALQLTSRIFTEGLLDKDHFIDWALTRFESATHDAIPLAMLVIQMIRPAITQSLKHGRRLAAISLSRLSELSSSPDKDIFEPLINRLVRLVMTLAVRDPECVILHRIWPRCRSTFLSLATQLDVTSALTAREKQENSHTDPPAATLRRVIDKNDSLVRATSALAKPEEPPALALIRKLDSFQPQTPLDQIASQSLAVVSDIRLLIKILMQWATSSYRSGMYRIFILVRLVQRWRGDGFDTDGHILTALGDFRRHHSLDSRKLSRLVAELMRLGAFDTARFLRSLISGGGLYDKDRSYDLQILVDMPLAQLPPNLVGLRSMLLRGRTSYETKDCASAEILAADLLQRILFTPDTREADILALRKRSSTLTWSNVFDLGAFIRASLKPEAQNDHRRTSQGENTNMNDSSGTLHTARMIASAEVTGDVVLLSDILTASTVNCDAECLVVIMETIDATFEDLAALGVADVLLRLADERYRSLRQNTTPLKRLIELLYSVSTRLPASDSTIIYFRRELATCNAGIGIAAHTPMSDMQVEPPSESENELERLLTGGAIMDSQRLSQAFEVILARAAKTTDLDQSYSALVQIISSLKGQNESSFQSVLSEWIQKALLMESNWEIRRAVSFLIRAGCLDMSAFALMVERICDRAVEEDVLEGFALSAKAFGLFLPDRDDESRSAFVTSVHEETISRIGEVNPELLLRLFLRALKANDTSTHLGGETIWHNSAVLGLLRHLIITNQSSIRLVLDSSIVSDDAEVQKRLGAFLIELSDPSGQLGLGKLSNPEQASVMFQTVDELSLPFYQLSFQFMRDDPAVVSQISTACFEKVIEREMQGCELWPALISSVNVKVAQQVRKSAEENVLLESSTLAEVVEKLRNATQPDVRFWSKLIEATSFSIPEQGEIEIGRAMEKDFGLASSILANDTDTQDELQQLWLQALCHLSIVHHKSCSGPTTKMKIAHTLCGLLARNVGQLNADSAASVFDTAAFFVEDLVPQAIVLLRNNLGPLKNDARVRFLFGVHDNADAWLFTTRKPTAQQQQQQGPEQSSLSLYPLRRWELLPESAANVGANDTALSLRLFDATKVP